MKSTFLYSSLAPATEISCPRPYCIDTITCRDFYILLSNVSPAAQPFYNFIVSPKVMLLRSAVQCFTKSSRSPRTLSAYPLHRTARHPLNLPPSKRSIQTQQFSPFAPPTPESLGRAAPPKQYKRSIKYGRRFMWTAGVLGGLYLADTQLYASSITRSLRTFGLGIFVAMDYKLNFRPKPWVGGTIEDLHRRR